MTKKMEPVPNVQNGGTHLFAFEYAETLTSVGNGESVLIPSDISNISVTVSFTGGASGYVQATTDMIGSVILGTAIWVTWEAGEVSVTTQDSAYPPTAIRAVQSGAGTMTMTVRAQ